VDDAPSRAHGLLRILCSSCKGASEPVTESHQRRAGLLPAASGCTRLPLRLCHGATEARATPLPADSAHLLSWPQSGTAQRVLAHAIAVSYILLTTFLRFFYLRLPDS